MSVQRTLPFSTGVKLWMPRWTMAGSDFAVRDSDLSADSTNFSMAARYSFQ